MKALWAHSGRFGVRSALGEACLVFLAVVLLTYARLGQAVAIQGGAPLIYKVLVVSLVWQACLYFTDLYDLHTMLDRRLTAIRIGQAWGTATLSLAVVYFWFPDLAMGRVVMAMVLIALPAIAFARRFLVDDSLRRHGTRERLLIVGTNAQALRLAKELHDQRDNLALEIVGFVDRDPARVGTPLFNPSIVGAVGRLGDVIAERSADRVAIGGDFTLDETPLDEVMRLRFAGVTFDYLPAVYEEYTGKVAIDALTPVSLMASAGFQRHSWLMVAKRASDIVVSVIGLILAFPFMLLAALLVKATSPGPVFYRQQRVGQNGRIFALYKFRSMRQDAEQVSGPVWASPNDSRITGIGRWLRRSRFDEVPQLWNVLRGEMSIVGPRPERPEMDVTLLEEISLYAQRRLVKPGITGWAQVRHAYAASVIDARVKLQYDLFYIKNLSFALDLLIVLLTVKTVLRGFGAR